MRAKVFLPMVGLMFGLAGLTGIPSPSVAAQESHPAANAMAAKKAQQMSITSLQEALNRHGAKLKVDGKLGRKTRAALKKFQVANGIKGTGRVDKTTRVKLGI